MLCRSVVTPGRNTKENFGNPIYANRYLPNQGRSSLREIPSAQMEPNRMKVLVISAAFPPMRAGEAEHAAHLCRRLAEQGLEVHVLTTKTDGPIEGFPFKVYPCIRRWSWVDLPALVKFMKLCSPNDAILLLYSGWIYNHHPMITFAPTISKSLLPGVRFVTQFEVVDRPQRGDSFVARVKRRLIDELVKLWAGSKGFDKHFGTLFRDSDQVIALSEHHLETFSQRFPPIKVKSYVIPPPPLLNICPDRNGTVRQSSRESIGVTEDDFLFAYFGFITQGKGVETLLEAFRIVASKRRNVRLTFIGGGRGYVVVSTDQQSQEKERYEQAIRELPNRLGIDTMVTWTNGYVSGSDQASAYLWAADACVLPFDDGVRLNNSTLAAAATHGLPIITTRGNRIESAFNEQVNVLFCPPKNPEAMATVMERLIANSELRQRLKDGARTLARERFSWDKAMELTISALEGKKEDL
jgi:polysaccharide biosynthesis protein PslF